MTTLDDRPRTALLVVDVQNEVVAQAHDRDAVVERIVGLVARARSAGLDVVWVQHGDDDLPRGSEGWRYVPELAQEPREPVVHKAYGDAFEATDLETVLAERRIGRLVVAGAETDQCIRSTLHGANTRGYDTVLVEDAHTANDNSSYGAPTPDMVIAHTNLYWRFHEAPGRTTEVVAADALDLAALRSLAQPR